MIRREFKKMKKLYVNIVSMPPEKFFNMNAKVPKMIEGNKWTPLRLFIHTDSFHAG